MQLQLAYLKSNGGMGQAKLSCSGKGCTCIAGTLDGHHESQMSGIEMQPVFIQPSAEYSKPQAPGWQPPECLLSIEVLKESSSQGHKVKVFGLALGLEKTMGARDVHSRAVDTILGEGLIRP